MSRQRSSSVDFNRGLAPQSRGAAVQSSAALFQRSVEHAKRRKEWIEREAVSKQMNELNECTFAPTINVRSRRIGVSRRHRSTVSGALRCP